MPNNSFPRWGARQISRRDISSGDFGLGTLDPDPNALAASWGKHEPEGATLPYLE